MRGIIGHPTPTDLPAKTGPTCTALPPKQCGGHQPTNNSRLVLAKSLDPSLDARFAFDALENVRHRRRPQARHVGVDVRAGPGKGIFEAQGRTHGSILLDGVVLVTFFPPSS